MNRLKYLLTATAVATSIIGTFGTAIPATAQSQTIFCSPYGTSNGAGTKENPMDVETAIKQIPAGGTIYMLGGTYTFDKTIVIDSANNGTAGSVKTIRPYNGESVVWNFSNMKVDPSNRGVVLDGDYWHFYGFEITKAGDNGMLLSGNNNKIERMIFNDNQDTGLQISRYNTKDASIADWPSYNLVINCTSKNNCDDATMENADGFAAKLTCGEGNIFDGCMSYNNSDDGWDLYAKTATGPIGTVTIQNCIAFRNGYTEFGEGYGDCDGNGFKLGGGGVGSPHVVKNCLSFENLHCGFTDNNNLKLESLTNCTAFNNNFDGQKKKPNFSVYRCTDDGCDFSGIVSYYTKNAVNDKFVGTIENAIVYNNGGYKKVDGKINIANNDKISETASLSDSDFVGLSAPAMGENFDTLWRKSDGTLNVGGFMQLKNGGMGFSDNYTCDYVTTFPADIPDSSIPDSSSEIIESSSVADSSSEIIESSSVADSSSETIESSSIADSSSEVTESSSIVDSSSEATESSSEIDSSSALDYANVLRGDVIWDNQLASDDALEILKNVVGIVTFNDAQNIVADVNNDGKVNTLDALAVLKCVVGLEQPQYVSLVNIRKPVYDTSESQG